MKTISGCTIVRNAVKLNYPLEASILTYLPICKEVVIAYDPTSEDDTENYVKALARKYKEIVLVPSPWNLNNHHDGTEITIQSNVAIDACTSDWGLYVQADEAIHEGDHQAILRAIEDPDVAGAVFERRSFLYTLEQEIPEYFARNLLRLYRRGEGFAIGDAMTCGLVEGTRGRVIDPHWRMYNYSRMGEKGEILTRCRDRDNFHHDTKQAVEENQQREFTQNTKFHGAREHPEAIFHFYDKLNLATTNSVASDKPQAAEVRAAKSTPVRFAVSLVALMGNEKDNVLPFLWQFRDWEGDVVIVDDHSTDGSAERLRYAAREVLNLPPDRCTILRQPIAGDFAGARNLAQAQAQGRWVLHCDFDEQWSTNLLRELPKLVDQLDRDGKTICGFPCANFLDGVLVNDIHGTEWTRERLTQALETRLWPPQNKDIHHRLMRRENCWVGRLHEGIEGLAAAEEQEQVVVLRDFWILHSKSFERQLRQDRFYRDHGQAIGMPDNEPAAPRAQSPALTQAAPAEQINFQVRPGSFDRGIFDAVVKFNEYKLPDQFEADDVLLDIGAHIGSFAVAAFMRGAGRVFSVEANEENYAMATKNLEPFIQAGRATVLHAAAWRSDGVDEPLAISSYYQEKGELNTGGCAINWQAGGRPVKNIPFDQLLAEVTGQFRKRVRLLKLDCEGSEWPILLTSKHLNSIDQIHGEFHEIGSEYHSNGARTPQINLPGYDRYTVETLQQFLEEQGFRVECHRHRNYDGSPSSLGMFFANRF